MNIKTRYELETDRETNAFASALSEVGIDVAYSATGPEAPDSWTNDIDKYYIIWKRATITEDIFVKRTFRDWLFDRKYNSAGQLIEEGPSFNRYSRVIFGVLSLLLVVIGLPLIITVCYKYGIKNMPLALIGTVYALCFGAFTANEGFRRFGNGNGYSLKRYSSGSATVTHIQK